MYLGQYLLEKKLVNEKEVLTSVIEQLESSPSTLRVIAELNLVPPTILISLIDSSIKSQKTVSQLLLEKKLISTSDWNKVLEEQARQTKTLSEIILEKNLLNHADCKEAIEASDSLDSTMDESPGANEFEIEATSAEESSQAADDDEEISWAALETLKETGAVPEDELKRLEAKLKKKNSIEKSEIKLVEEIAKESTPELDLFTSEFVSLLNESRVQDLKEKWNQLEGQNINGIDQLFDELHLLTGAAKMAGLQLFTKLFESWEKVVESIKKSNQLDHLMIVEGNFMLDIAWSLRNGLIDFGNESVLLTKLHLKDKYLDSMRKAISIIKKAG